MARYQRRHSGPNISNGVMWLMLICGAAYIVYKIVSCNHAIKAASEYETKEIKSEKAKEIVINDSTNKMESPR
jgi:hypothetical protein